MSYKISVLTALTVVLLSVLVCLPRADAKYWDLPKMAEPPAYGDILIDRLSTKNGVEPVYFSHWQHRLDYTCRVCHFELEFEFKVGATEITEEENRQGYFCGACHNNKVAFGHDKKAACKTCHSGKIEPNEKYFQKIFKKLPGTRFGNRINWVKARRITRPEYSIFRIEKPMRFTKLLRMKAEWAIIPDAIFPHSAHVRWLDCSNCHPKIFNLKKKTTKHFSMNAILDKQFCGVCHLSVAFPLNDCQRCHPGMDD